MKKNPFVLDKAPCWLDTQNVSVIRGRLLKATSDDQDFARQLPRLGGKKALAAITTFFSPMTCPLAEVIEALSTSQIQRSEEMVAEILRRMACVAGRKPLPPEVIRGVRILLARPPVTLAPNGEKIFQLQETTWRLSWHQGIVPIRRCAEITLPVLLLVTEEKSGKVLSFRPTSPLPTSEELGLTLYDALVYPQMEKPLLIHLRPPTCLQVQGSPSLEIRETARAWQIDVTTVEPTECIFLRQWEAELQDRILDPVHYLRIFDRACERTFGYAPFLQKQRFLRYFGVQAHRIFDPTLSFAGLRSLFPGNEVDVEEDGTLTWRGWHYRDMEEILPYWAHETVTVRPSPWTEALIWVYWNNSILCQAMADELRNRDGSFRPYWFPYPLLGE